MVFQFRKDANNTLYREEGIGDLVKIMDFVLRADTHASELLHHGELRWVVRL